MSWSLRPSQLKRELPRQGADFPDHAEFLVQYSTFMKMDGELLRGLRTLFNLNSSATVSMSFNRFVAHEPREPPRTLPDFKGRVQFDVSPRLGASS
jgi:hypothetical protein